MIVVDPVLSSAMPRRRVRRVVGATAVAVAVATGWVTLQVWMVRDDLQAAKQVATQVTHDLQAGETAQLGSRVEQLREHTRAAAERTDSVTWRALSVLPVVGDDIDAVGHVSRAADLIADEGLAPLVDSGLDPTTFAPRAGRIPLSPIERAAKPLARAAGGFANALDELARVDSGGLLGIVRAPYDDAVAEVVRGNRAVGAAALGAELLPGMLGGQEPRTYLVIFQNSAEARSLGGMPGIVTTLKADRGRLTLGDTIPVSSFGARDQPILPLTAEERHIWFDQPGTYFQDSLFIPDFPRASELMAARFADETGQQVDGVLSVDPAAMSYVVGASGGLTVDGVSLTQDNFIDELVHKTYLRFADDRVAEDDFFGAVAASVFDDALGGKVGPPQLIEALTRGVDEGRVLLHSFDGSEQTQFTGTRIAGELPVGAEGAIQVGVYVNDSTGSKMSYFLRHNTELATTSCASSLVQLNGRTMVHSDTPDDVASLPVPVTGSGLYGVPRGVQLDTLMIVGPVGGTIVDIKIDGEPTKEELATYRGRPVAKVPLWLEPRARLDVTWGMTSPARGASALELRTTPGVKSGGRIVRSTTECG